MNVVVLTPQRKVYGVITEVWFVFLTVNGFEIFQQVTDHEELLSFRLDE